MITKWILKNQVNQLLQKNISLKKSFCISLLLLSKYKEINLLSRYIIKQNSSRQKNSRNLVKKKKKTHDIPTSKLDYEYRTQGKDSELSPP